MKPWLQISLLCGALFLPSASTGDTGQVLISQKDGTQKKQTAVLPQSFKCPKCQGDMEKGYILDVQQRGGYDSASWVQGKLQRGFIYGLKVKLKREMVAERCTNCGYIELYAP